MEGKRERKKEEMERERERKSGMCSRIRIFFSDKDKGSVYSGAQSLIYIFHQKLGSLKIQDLKTYV